MPPCAALSVLLRRVVILDRNVSPDQCNLSFRAFFKAFQDLISLDFRASGYLPQCTSSYRCTGLPTYMLQRLRL